MTDADNPFFHNYVFSDKDLKRLTWSYWKYPHLLFYPTFVQMSEDGVVRYKQRGNQYFLIDIKPYPKTKGRT